MKTKKKNCLHLTSVIFFDVRLFCELNFAQRIHGVADDQLQFSRIPTRETMWPPMICEIGGLRVRGRMKGKTKEKGELLGLEPGTSGRIGDSLVPLRHVTHICYLYQFFLLKGYLINIYF